MKNFAIIAACDKNFGIGKSNLLPWRLPSELQYFQDTTANSTVIMGRKTWDSLPAKSKPLATRQNIVISRRSDLPLPESVLLAASLQDALEKSTQSKIFVIGGAQLYSESIQSPHCNQVYLTEIDGNFDCDAFFPGDSLAKDYKLSSTSDLQTENNINFYFNIYSRK